MSKFAENTSVSSEQSRMEIERTLRRYGATEFGYASSAKHAQVMFRCQDRAVRFKLDMPDPKDPDFTRTPGRNLARSAQQAEQAWEQACRQRWRALALVVKAKLEAVEANISTFEEEFMAHIVLPDGSTVGQHVLPRVSEAYATGDVRLLGQF